jgi:hypothetical protein
MPSFRSALSLVLHLTSVFGYNYGSLNQDAEPYVVAMFGNESTGPDGMLFAVFRAIDREFADGNERLGPWWYISQAIDFPDQHVPMLPSISQTSLAINDSACRSQTAACPLPLPNMLTLSGAYQVSDGPETQSDLRDASTWDADYAALLNLSGSGRNTRDRMTLHRDSYNNERWLCKFSLRLQESIACRSRKLTRPVLPERRSRPRRMGCRERYCQQRSTDTIPGLQPRRSPFTIIRPAHRLRRAQRYWKSRLGGLRHFPLLDRPNRL